MRAAPLPSLVVLDPVDGVSDDMFIAAVLDAWLGFAIEEAHVRFGSLGDMAACPRDVRSCPRSGH